MSVHRAFNHSLAAELTPCLAALAALFSSPASADFFYPNDQKVIIDVLVRLFCLSNLLPALVDGCCRFEARTTSLVMVVIMAVAVAVFMVVMLWCPVVWLSRRLVFVWTGA